MSDSIPSHPIRKGKAKYLPVVTNPNIPALAPSSLVGLGSDSFLPSSWTDSFWSLNILQCATLETVPWKEEIESVSYSRTKHCQVAGLVVFFYSNYSCVFSTVITVKLVINIQNSTDSFMKLLYWTIFVRICCLTF